MPRSRPTPSPKPEPIVSRSALSRTRRAHWGDAVAGLLLVLGGLGLGMAATAFAAEPDPAAGAGPTAADVDFFERRIRPVLAERCYECHSDAAGKAKGGLRLDTRAAIRRGGDSRPAVIPGQPGQSLLLEAIRYGNQDLKMPPKGRLDAAIVADFEAWIQRGAPDPREELPGASAPRGPAGEPSAAKAIVGSNHWAFLPPRAVEPPTPRRRASAAWVRSPIDAFVVARLEAAGLTPARPASKATLLRRVTFDLTGLPPTPEELDAFLADAAPDAFERVVERLLASPGYGERWGRHWLDVARYADSNGQDENKAMSHAWRYRDYVIDAFRRDKPYDQFIREQLAGDLLPAGATERETFDQWTATGFLVLGPKMLAEQDKPKLVMDVVDEQIDVVSRAFLGLTVSCSRCHDHKFDPIPARDYYALAGIFKSTKTMGDLAFVSKWNERPIATSAEKARQAEYQRQTNELATALTRARQSADRALRDSWRARAIDYLAAAEAVTSAPAAAGTAPGGHRWSSNDVAVAAARRDLHAPTLERWLGPVLAARTDPSSVLAPYLPAATRSAALLADASADAVRPGTNTTSNAGLRFGGGRLGYGLRCTGTNHLETPHADALEPAQLTVEAWVRVEASAAGRGGGPGAGDSRRWLVNKNANEWEQGHYALVLDGRRPGAYLNIGGGPSNAFSVWSDLGAIPTNEWHHLAFTYDGSDLRLYVNGEPAASTRIGKTRIPGSGPLHLGRRQDGYNYFVGDLDEVRLHRRALAASELRDQVRRTGAVASTPATAAATSTTPTPTSGSAAGSGVGAEPADGGGLIRHWAFEPATDAERASARLAQLHELLEGPNGLLAPPVDGRAWYPEATRRELDDLQAKLAELRSNTPPAAAVALAVEEAKPVDLPIHIRGSHLNLASERVPRGVLQAYYRGPAAEAPRMPSIPAERSGRLELAAWLTDPRHPLTARVAVNRVWQAFFGEGLVRTPDNFGVRGDAPTHPELLDWLARDFIARGWSFRQLHRSIVLSSAYQMSTAPDARGLRLDPGNQLLWRMNRRRLEAEPLRDALLAVSGRLDRTIGGTLVSWGNADYTPGETVSATSRRRAVYLPVVRDRVYDLFTIFDFANPSVGVSRRTPTVVAHQALFFLNSPFVKEQAGHLADGLLALATLDDGARVNEACRRVLGRPATQTEIRAALRFLHGPEARPGVTSPGGAPADAARREAWTDYCQALLASNEFLYLD